MLPNVRDAPDADDDAPGMPIGRDVDIDDEEADAEEAPFAGDLPSIFIPDSDFTWFSRKSSAKLNVAGGVIPRPMEGNELGNDVPNDPL